jgi:CRP-like cAMP-binding protein
MAEIGWVEGDSSIEDVIGAIHDIGRGLQRPELEHSHRLVDRFMELFSARVAQTTRHSSRRGPSHSEPRMQGRRADNTPGEFKKRLDSQSTK